MGTVTCVVPLLMATTTTVPSGPLNAVSWIACGISPVTSTRV
jgi:hypothetical protein